MNAENYVYVLQNSQRQLDLIQAIKIISAPANSVLVRTIIAKCSYFHACSIYLYVPWGNTNI
jgi:hypothetical protein